MYLSCVGVLLASRFTNVNVRRVAKYYTLDTNTRRVPTVKYYVFCTNSITTNTEFIRQPKYTYFEKLRFFIYNFQTVVFPSLFL